MSSPHSPSPSSGPFSILFALAVLLAVVVGATNGH